MQAGEAVRMLVAERPAFHHLDRGEAQSFGIQPEVLRWIADNVAPGSSTLETGAGHTTVVFCALGGQHTAVAPAATEFEAIRAYCAAKGIPTAGLEAQVGISQAVLPGLVDGPALDLVLIDGDHAFPGPFIDWYYTADRLKEGGWLLVDDTQLETGHVLREFLRAEDEWQHVADLGKTAIFRRLTGAPVTGKWWGQQPWASRIHAIQGDGLSQKVAIARTRLKLRTRLRAAVRRRLAPAAD